MVFDLFSMGAKHNTEKSDLTFNEPDISPQKCSVWKSGQTACVLYSEAFDRTGSWRKAASLAVYSLNKKDITKLRGKTRP